MIYSIQFLYTLFTRPGCVLQNSLSQTYFATDSEWVSE